MNRIKEEITIALEKAIKEVTGEDISVVLDLPKGEGHGDYSTNIAMILFKKYQVVSSKYYGKKPMDLAEDIVKTLNTYPMIHNTCSGIIAAAPGFINISLSQEALLNNLKKSNSEEQQKKGKRVMVEFTDPNPFKEFHIGHLYSNVVGESLSRLFQSQGADVWRVTYQGDVGLHVAKSVWGMQKLLDEMPSEEASLREKAAFLGKAYAFGAIEYDQNAQSKAEIITINKKIYEQNPEILPFYEKGKKWSLAYFETIYARLGSTFIKNYFESVAGPIGLALVKENIGRGIFKESEGAVIFEGEKYGLHNRVFINSLGLPTYEAKDMGLPPTKYKDFPYDESIIITAEEQSAYFRVVLKALSLISPELGARTKHIAHGMVRLPSGKMSSRTGDVITGEWLLNTAKENIQKSYPEMDEKTAEMVAIGAVKYALLRGGIGRDIIFDFEESVSLEGNSGPYLQYTYARTQSVVRKSQISNLKSQINTNDWKFEIGNLKLEIEEVQLLRHLFHFEEIVSEATEHLSPHMVAQYLFVLAQRFNLFYQKCPILESDQKDFRLKLTASVGEVLKNGLSLLGIQVPEHM